MQTVTDTEPKLETSTATRAHKTAPTLLDPVRIGAWQLPNRIVMSPLTRARAGVERVPNALMAEYYRQRASTGLIISEATSVTPMGVGYADTPGVWSEEQVAGWRLVTEAVHEAGGRILLQLWHVGRISDPIFLNGETPVAPSAVQPAGHVSLVRPMKPFVTPRALRLDELPGIIEAYRKGAENAQRAGFDGVEIHGANGYLLDQFLQDKTNHRTDEYGGSIENRARLMLEATDAAISVWGADRVGMHLAPRGDAHDMGDSNPLATFSHVARELGRRKIAFIAAREHLGEGRIGPELKAAFGGAYIANEKFTLETANQVLAAGEADAVAFGVPLIANPDLVERFRRNAPLNPPDQSTFYAPGPDGYTDYPFLLED
ncbi:MAG TPA: alkene reductase [Verrucomicrobiota bacterium]|nr:alkene reductase [Verrucomicrobiota bacterium]